jgi:hypothetical protein
MLDLRVGRKKMGPLPVRGGPLPTESGSIETQRACVDLFSVNKDFFKEDRSLRPYGRYWVNNVGVGAAVYR